MSQEQQQLTSALQALAQKILSTDEEDHLALAKQLLLDLNPYLESEIAYCSSFAAIKSVIQQYYQQQRKEEINWGHVLQNYKGLSLVGLFVLDLALNFERSSYIESILELPQGAQLTLKPFVQQVTQRHHFISPNSPQQHQQSAREHLLQLSQQNQKLKHQKEHWIRKYQDLKQNYDDLRANNDKMCEEFNYLKQQRYMLISELGGSECGSVEETIERVKRQWENYERSAEKIQKELDEKKTSLGNKNEELLKIEESIKRNRYEEKMGELEAAIGKISSLEKDLNQVKIKEEDLRSEVYALKQFVASKEEECFQLKKQLNTLETYEAKYLSIRKLHNQFKSKIVKNVKQLKQ